MRPRVIAGNQLCGGVILPPIFRGIVTLRVYGFYLRVGDPFSLAGRACAIGAAVYAYRYTLKRCDLELVPAAEEKKTLRRAA
ncbi:MAG: hypothetical protein U0805_16640 [Pirellulales bacterium]